MVMKQLQRRLRLLGPRQRGAHHLHRRDLFRADHARRDRRRRYRQDRSAAIWENLSGAWRKQTGYSVCSRVVWRSPSPRWRRGLGGGHRRGASGAPHPDPLPMLKKHGERETQRRSMQLGMVGLGGWARTWSAASCAPAMTAWSTIATRSRCRRWRRRARSAARASPTSCRAWRAAARVGHVAGGRATEAAIGELAALLAAGDCIIDGGNSFCKDDVRRAGDAEGAGASTTSTSAPPAASGASSAATA